MTQDAEPTQDIAWPGEGDLNIVCWNGLKSVEDALNDGAARMQQILDRAE